MCAVRAGVQPSEIGVERKKTVFFGPSVLGSPPRTDRSHEGHRRHPANRRDAPAPGRRPPARHDRRPLSGTGKLRAGRRPALQARSERRLKRGDEAIVHRFELLTRTPSTHPLTGRELRALRRLYRETESKSPFLFLSERGSPMTVSNFQKLISRACEAARLKIKAHPHMLRHACGFHQA